jgi:hypothetical protein
MGVESLLVFRQVRICRSDIVQCQGLSGAIPYFAKQGQGVLITV